MLQLFHPFEFNFCYFSLLWKCDVHCFKFGKHHGLDLKYLLSVATITGGNGPTSCDQYPVLVAMWTPTSDATKTAANILWCPKNFHRCHLNCSWLFGSLVSQKAALERTTKTSAKGPLDETLCACSRGNNPPDQQVAVVYAPLRFSVVSWQVTY